MKKLSVFFLLLLALGLNLALPSGAATQAGTVVRVHPSPVTLNPGASASIEIWVDNVADLAAFSIQVSFDASRLSADALQEGNFLDLFFAEPTNGIDNAAGVISFGYAQGPASQPKSGSGLLFSFTITAKSLPGQTPLDFTSVELVDADYFLIPTDMEAGVVRVTGALPDAYQVGQDQVLNVPAPGVLANDIGPANATLTAELVDPLPADKGTLVLNTNGALTYTPPAGWTGTTGFTYRACSGDWCSAKASVTIEVLAGPTPPPVAVDDAYQATADQVLNVPAPGVLGNDLNPSGLALTAELVNPVSPGGLVFNANGAFAYTPPAGWTGAATFTYRACNASLCSAPATVTITVAGAPAPPVAADDAYQTGINLALNIPAPGVLANDLSPSGLPLTAELVNPPGVGVLNLLATGAFTFTPPADWTGTTTFTYRACDTNLCSDPATVTITVTATPAAPVALADAFETGKNQVLNVPAPGVLANDLSPSGLPLTAEQVDPPSVGVLNLLATGTFTYTPPPDWTGTATFTYRACDAFLCSDPAVVTITISDPGFVLFFPVIVQSSPLPAQ